jgi:hypothetical protein
LRDPASIKAPWRTFEYIETKANALRNKYPKWCDTIPVDIERLIEIGFGVKFQFEIGLNQRVGIDALLLNTRPVQIAIDEEQYWADDQHRVRFSLAHEIAHLYLHKNVYKGISFANSTEWRDFMLDVPIQTHLWLEKQANHFAGCLLVPSDLLANRLAKHREQTGLQAIGLIRKLSNNFVVSDECMRIRLEKANLIEKQQDPDW